MFAQGCSKADRLEAGPHRALGDSRRDATHRFGGSPPGPFGASAMRAHPGTPDKRADAAPEPDRPAGKRNSDI